MGKELTGDYRCPAREGTPDAPRCNAPLVVYGDREYTIHPVTGALQKSAEMTYDICCEHGHQLVKETTNVNGALRILLEPDRGSIVDSDEFESKLSRVVQSSMEIGAGHDSDLTDAIKGLKHFLKRHISVTRAA